MCQRRDIFSVGCHVHFQHKDISQEDRKGAGDITVGGESPVLMQTQMTVFIKEVKLCLYEQIHNTMHFLSFQTYRYRTVK